MRATFQNRGYATHTGRTHRKFDADAREIIENLSNLNLLDFHAAIDLLDNLDSPHTEEVKEHFGLATA